MCSDDGIADREDCAEEYVNGIDEVNVQDLCDPWSRGAIPKPNLSGVERMRRLTEPSIDAMVRKKV